MGAQVHDFHTTVQYHETVQNVMKQYNIGMPYKRAVLHSNSSFCCLHDRGGFGGDSWHLRGQRMGLLRRSGMGLHGSCFRCGRCSITLGGLACQDGSHVQDRGAQGKNVPLGERVPDEGEGAVEGCTKGTTAQEQHSW